jgi:hypothetical protein
MKKLSVILALIVVLMIPLAASAQVSTYDSGFQVQNLESTDANVVITFYNKDGTTEATVNDTIVGDSSTTYFPLAAVSDGFDGSVVISSDKQVAAVANVVADNLLYNASYTGFSAGASPVSLPLVMKNNFGISTWFNVQNTGLAAADVTVSFSGESCDETKTVEPNASQTWYQDPANNTCLPDGYVGAATVTSAEPVVATVMQVNGGQVPDALLSYNGFTTSATEIIMPLVSHGWYGSGTGIQIANTGGTATDVTLSFTPSPGFAGNDCDQTLTVPAGASTTFAFPPNDIPAACLGPGAGGPAAFVGSAAVTDNTASMPLTAIVNQVTPGTPASAAYNAFDASVATDQVSLPLLMDRRFGIFTGFSVANLGTVDTDITCNYVAGSGFPAPITTSTTETVAPGSALTRVNDPTGDELGNDWVGSAVCTSTGEPIGAVVNQLNTGTVLTVEDGLLVSEGINY